MRSLRLLSGAFAPSIVATAALLAGCSASPTGGGPITGNYQEPTGSSGGSNESGGGSSSGGSTSGGSSSGGSTTGGSSSGATSSSSSGSSSGGATTGGNTISADTTWADGTTITEATTIAAGVTVTIAPAAKITVSTGVAITVAGTLNATTSTTHAQLTGTTWGGVVVAKGGTVTADSLDFSGASMDVTGTATYSNGTITAATSPIAVETGGSLTMTTVTVTGTLGLSHIDGSFTASHLTYNSNGNEIQIADPTAIVKIDNSTFTGTGDQTADMISVNACASLTMTYTTITACHCAYHFNDITSFDLENMDLHGASYGFMAYGSSPTSGTRVFKNSNVETMAVSGISELGTNGAITVSGVYFDTSSKLALTDQEITISDAATAPLPATSVGPQ